MAYVYTFIYPITISVAIIQPITNPSWYVVWCFLFHGGIFDREPAKLLASIRKKTSFKGQCYEINTGAFSSAKGHEKELNHV